jgi:DNA-binding HxlR family transcriptional regulator
MSKNSHVASRALTNQWTLRVAHVLRNGPLRFNALDRAVDAPNPPMLSTHLKKMRRDGLVERHVIELGPPARVEYSLTPLGADLARPASAMVTWVDCRMPEVEVARERYRVLQAQELSVDSAVNDENATA